MTTELENEVRQAMATKAGALPGGSAARVRAFDYHPRRRRAPVAAAFAGAATAGTVVAVVVTGGAPAAYAGWSATPTSAATPSPTADASCQSQLENSGSVPPGTSEPASGTWSSVLTDVRGPFTVGLFQNGSAYAACFTSPSFTVLNQVSSDGSGHAGGRISVSQQADGTQSPSSAGQAIRNSVGIAISRTSSGSLTHVVQDHLSNTSDGAYTFVDGTTAAGVTGVTLGLDDGQDVVATVADGWFLAWWPGGATANSAQVSTASGTSNEQLVPLSVPTPPGGPVSGPGSTGNPSSGSATSGNSGSGGPSTNENSGSGGAGNSGPSTSTGGTGGTGAAGAG